MNKKPIIATAVVTKTKSVLVLLDPKTMKGGVFFPGSVKDSWDSEAVEGVEMITLTHEQIKGYKKNTRLITFGRSDQTYLIGEMMANSSQDNLFRVYDEIVNNFVAGFKINPKPKSLYGNFELENIFRQGTLPEEVLSRLGESITPLSIDPNSSKELTSEEVKELVSYAIKRAKGTAKVFNHSFSQGEFTQMSAMIERYLGGGEYFYSQNGSKLATSALTQAHIKNRKPFINHKSSRFKWNLNGVDVLSVIPEVWKTELIEFATKMENAHSEYLKRLSLGASDRDASSVFKEIPFPSVSFPLNDQISVQSGGGGLHTKHAEKLIRRSNVHHHDIEGAYTAMILALGVFSPEIEAVYKGFKDDKFAYKKLKKVLEKSFDNGAVSVGQIADYAKTLGIKISKSISIGELMEIISKGVAASKLATNKPTGVADQLGTPLYNPIGMIEARIILQIVLYDLAKRIISAGGEVLSINTDGLFWCDNNVVDFSVVEEWSSFWNLAIGYDNVPNYIAKSDNDRLLLDENKKIIEAAGDDLVHQSFSDLFKLGTKPLVVDRVVAQKLINPDTPLLDLLKKEFESGDVEAFMFTSKAQRHSKTVVNLKVAPRVNRFLLTKTGDSIGTYLVKTEAIGKLINVPDSPVRIFNDKIPEKLPEDLNLDAYLGLIETVYSHWD